VAAQDDGTRTRRRKPAAQRDAATPPPDESPRKRQRRPRPEEATSVPTATPSAKAPQQTGKRQPRRRATLQPKKPMPPAAGAPTPAEELVAPADLMPEGRPGEGIVEARTPTPGAPSERRRRERGAHSNALGMLIERHFNDPASPCRSYSDLERHSTISREALSRYVTARPDRRRSPTIDTLVGIADAMHLSLEAVCRAAAASAKGVIPPPEQEQQAREEVVGTLVTALTDEQFGAVVELLRQLRPLRGGT